MDSIILDMLEFYNCQSKDDYENALKEIMQEIALLGLWRAKFFEHALFYGGTALRILYKLPRFSEDLDFSLLVPNKNFNLTPYHNSVVRELKSFGFDVEIKPKKKSINSQVESAFIKASTKVHLIKVSAPLEISSRTQTNQVLKIKMEIDTNPPGMFNVEVRDLLRPVPFQVKTMTMDNLFAGKCHDCLAREWKGRVKGRDFYDYLWYLRKRTSLNIKHLKARLIQSGHWNEKEELDLAKVKNLFIQKFESLDFDKVKEDVYVFLDEREKKGLDVWSKEFFINSLENLK